MKLKKQFAAITTALCIGLVCVPFKDAIQIRQLLEASASNIEEEQQSVITYSLGDLNGDGATNATDASLILTESAQVGLNGGGSFTELQQQAADLNGDGAISASDASAELVFTAKAGIGCQLTIKDYVYQLRLPISLSVLPAFSGEPYLIVNDGKPFFSVSDYDVNTSFEYYSDLDSLGRCQVCVANIGQDIMPTEPRGEIGMVKPTGWQTVRYDGIVDGNYLYNRCHLIGYQLAGENANVQNLITGTRYMNVQGMLPFENQVYDYVAESGNHVLYRVTPIFDSDDLLAHGVLMEGYSVEDAGAGVCFCVYCYNAQPSIVIDYPTGDSQLLEEPERTAPAETTTEPITTTVPTDTTTPATTATTTTATPVTTTTTPTTQTTATTTTTTTTTTRVMTTTTTTQAPPKTSGLYYDQSIGVTYVCNTNTKKFHKPGCSEVSRIKAGNRFDVSNSREEIIGCGYAGCKKCNP